MDFLSILVWIVILILAYTVISYLQAMKFAKDLKEQGLGGPEPQLFWQGLVDFFKAEGKPYLFADKCYKKYGRVYGSYFMFTHCITVGDPEIVKQILVKEFPKFHDRMLLIDFPEPQASNLFNVRGERWKFIRGAISPTFTSGKLRQLTWIVNSLGDVLISKLKKDSDKKITTDFVRLLQSFTMDVILTSAFGVEGKTQTDPKNSITEKAKLSLEFPWWISVLLIFPFGGKILSYLPFGQGAQFKPIEKVAKAVIKETRNMPKEKKDLLQLMLDTQSEPDSQGRSLTDVEIIAQSVLFINAGYETTSTTLALTCYHLAIYPEIQEKLYQEIKTCWPKDGALPSYDTVQQMQYLEMVISEVLRLYPPGFGLIRYCNEAFKINGIEFREGYTIFIPSYSMHRDPEFWEDPEKFDPERFSPEAKAQRDPYTYLPFGHGPRNCIGMRFALMEMKIILSRILMEFQVERTDETSVPVKIACQSTLTVQDPIILRAVKRET